MGCDIHAYAERKAENGQFEVVDVAPFEWRNYGVFGWLADARNYSAVTPISKPRGIPDDISAPVRESYAGWDTDAHSASWLSIAELLAVDYEQAVENRRCTVQTGPNSYNGGATCEPGRGDIYTLREFLGQSFFDDLYEMQSSGVDRVVFWFDN